MSQYEAARYIFDEDDAVSVQELMSELNVVESSCRTSLIKLQKRGLVEQQGSKYYPHPEASEEDLERIRPRTLSELKDE